jgi:flagellum-specific peptidoglycan hydrolase FlgJ
MKIKHILFLCIAIFLIGCGGKRTVVQKNEKKPIIVEPIPIELPSVAEKSHVKKLARKNANLNKHTLVYIEKYASIAVKEMHAYKIPASITLAQGILESGRGRSELALKSNNHFGIKCHTGWLGERVYHDDDAKGECFRKYLYPETSYEDHSKFLTERRRYAFLFNYKKDDYKKWAYGLKKAGYATDKKYPVKLIKIIKDYELYVFDKIKESGYDKKIRELNKDRKVKQKRVKEIVYKVKKGDTLYSISRKYGVAVEDIKKANNLTDNVIAIGQKLVVKM